MYTRNELKIHNNILNFFFFFLIKMDLYHFFNVINFMVNFD